MEDQGQVVVRYCDGSPNGSARDIAGVRNAAGNVVGLMGLVAQVFDESVLSTLRGHIAVGHCRYSTSGSSVWENAQPTFRSTPSGSLALGHNGNLINTLELAAMVEGAADQWRGPVGTSDTDVLTALFADPRSASVADSALAALPLVRGAFSLVFMPAERRRAGLRGARGSRQFVSLLLHNVRSSPE